jgi:hypothetical protein
MQTQEKMENEKKTEEILSLDPSKRPRIDKSKFFYQEGDTTDLYIEFKNGHVWYFKVRTMLPYETSYKAGKKTAMVDIDTRMGMSDHTDFVYNVYNDLVVDSEPKLTLTELKLLDTPVAEYIILKLYQHVKSKGKNLILEDTKKK